VCGRSRAAGVGDVEAEVEPVRDLGERGGVVTPAPPPHAMTAIAQEIRGGQPGLDGRLGAGEPGTVRDGDPSIAWSA